MLGHITIMAPGWLRHLEDVKKARRALSVGAPRRPSIRGNRWRGRGGRTRAMSVGGKAPSNVPNASGNWDCTTYDAPPIPTGADGCPDGYNGCGDTIGIDTPVAIGATVDIVVPAAISFTPRIFIYTGTAGAFTINNIRVANGPDSNFGAGYNADVYRFDSFTSRDVSWPEFYNSPGLIINVTNTTAGIEDFEGVLKGAAAHA